MTPVKRRWAEIRPHITPEFAARLWALADKSGGELACWPYTGNRSPGGYGVINVPRVPGTIGTHRIAYGLTYGDAGDGMNVLHCCDNRACMNPNHLRAGTHRENIAQSWESGGLREVILGRTHCKRGHAYPDAVETRRCLICFAASNAAKLERAHERNVERAQSKLRGLVGDVLPATLAELILVVGERRARVLCRNFGLYGTPRETLQDIGDSLGISRERARQLCNDAARKLGADLTGFRRPGVVAEIRPRKRRAA